VRRCPREFCQVPDTSRLADLAGAYPLREATQDALLF